MEPTHRIEVTCSESQDVEQLARAVEAAARSTGLGGNIQVAVRKIVKGERYVTDSDKAAEQAGENSASKTKNDSDTRTDAERAKDLEKRLRSQNQPGLGDGVDNQPDPQK